MSSARPFTELLPDEILEQIIKGGYTTDIDGHDFSTALSLVCRRLRKLVIGTPGLWNVLSNHMTADQLVTTLERSLGIVESQKYDFGHADKFKITMLAFGIETIETDADLAVFVNEDKKMRHLIPNRLCLVKWRIRW